MKTRSTRGAGMAFLVGLFLVIEGTWGFFSPVVFGGLTINPTRALIHFILGLGAILTSGWRPATYLTFLGVIITSVGVLWGIPATRHFVVDFLAVNRPGAIVDVLLGFICLVTGSVARSLTLSDLANTPGGRTAI